MSITGTKLRTCLWFNGNAEEAAKQYTSIFPNSEITHIQRYSAGGAEVHGHAPGDVLTVSFTLSGHPFVILNGGPEFKHSEAVSFQVECEDQAEVDYYWEKLREGGDEKKQQCGWLADKWGISWQVVPKQLLDWMRHEDTQKVDRVFGKMVTMVKMDIEGLRKAFEGET